MSETVGNVVESEQFFQELDEGMRLFHYLQVF